VALIVSMLSYTECHYAERCYAECHYAGRCYTEFQYAEDVILSVIILNVVAPLKGLPFVFLVQLRHQSDALK
jgi:hypothetical protein